MASPLPQLDERYTAPSLSFTLNSPTTNTLARSGELFFHPHSPADSPQPPTPTRVIPTPTVIAYARRGALPHLTRDNVARLPNEMVHLSLEHFLDQPSPTFSQAPFSLHRFIGLHESKSQRQQLLAMGLRDSSDDSVLPANTDECVMATTTRGVVKVTPRDFLASTLPRPPDILFALTDDPVGQLSNKRAEKSVRRSLQWVSEVARGAKGRTNVFAPLVGAGSSQSRIEYSKGLIGVSESRPTSATRRELGEPSIDHDVAGYSLTLDPSLSPADADTVTISPTIPSLFLSSLCPLSPTKPRVVISAAGPHDILRLVRDVGFDLFVDNWSSACSTIGVGLDFSFPVVASLISSHSSSPNLLPSGKLDIGHSLFDHKFDRSFTPLSLSPLAISTEPHPFGPSPPTRAYVHHLLQAHEMTAHVILALHNHLVTQAFFASIRSLLASDDKKAFGREVDRFFETYEEGRAFNGGVYPCVESARSELERVERERGKGSLKEKLLRADEEAGVVADAKEQVQRILLEL